MPTPAEQPLRVLILVNRLFEWSQNFITRELTELNEQGVQFFIGTRSVIVRDDLSEREKKLLPKVILTPENPFLPGSLWRHLLFSFKHPKAYGRAWKAFFQIKHEQKKRCLRTFICLFRAAAVAQWVLDRNVNLIHAHFFTAPAEMALYLSQLTGVPFGGTAHAMDIYVDNSGLASKIARAAYLTTCTAANERHLIASGLIAPEKLIQLYHGIEISTPNPSIGNRKSPIVNPVNFLAVGRLVPKKGYSFLLQACQLLKIQGLDFQCRIIGKGPLEDEIRQQIETLGLGDCVRLDGYVPPNRMTVVYHRSDVLVVPSIVGADGDVDGLPNVCLEAMMHGLPIIGSHVSGIPEGVADGENGWLVPPSDAVKLAEAMRQAIASPDLSPMREAALRKVQAHFSLENNIRALRKTMERHQNRPKVDSLPR